jgi:hypothetical protein
MESVALKTVSVTAIWSAVYIRGIRQTETRYDIISFEAEEIKTQFAGKDW